MIQLSICGFPRETLRNHIRRCPLGRTQQSSEPRPGAPAQPAGAKSSTGAKVGISRLKAEENRRLSARWASLERCRKERAGAAPEGGSAGAGESCPVPRAFKGFSSPRQQVPPTQRRGSVAEPQNSPPCRLRRWSLAPGWGWSGRAAPSHPRAVLRGTGLYGVTPAPRIPPGGGGVGVPSLPVPRHRSWTLRFLRQLHWPMLLLAGSVGPQWRRRWGCPLRRGLGELVVGRRKPSSALGLGGGGVSPPSAPGLSAGRGCGELPGHVPTAGASLLQRQVVAEPSVGAKVGMGGGYAEG